MIELQNRTIICTVLFLDIVEYSRKPVAEQMSLRDRFNVLLRDALGNVAANDRVILDTGDGAAITFLGEPEGAVLIATRLREAIAAELLPREHQLSLRCGINLGPVKLVRDINARPNIIGDGINVAQRIMGFAQPGQVLVSRSYFEVVSRLSAEYANLFQHEGARTDKHLREHEIYALGSEQGAQLRTAGSGAGWKDRMRKLVPTLAQAADWMPSNPLASTLMAMCAILAVGAVTRAYREPEPRIADLTPREMRRLPPDLSALPPPSAGSQASAASAPEIRLAEAVPIPIATPGAAVDSSAEPTAASSNRRPVSPRKPIALLRQATALPVPEEAMKSVEAPTPAPAAAQDLVRISIAAFPWGEIYVDGAHQGISPPMHSIQVRPGRHEIEIRNTTFPAHRSTIDVGTNDRVTIRHRFQAGERQ